MELTARLSASNDSRETAAAEVLEALEVEREISMGLIGESEQLVTTLIKALDRNTPAALLGERERVRLHLTALRAFLGGGFQIDTEES